MGCLFDLADASLERETQLRGRNHSTIGAKVLIAGINSHNCLDTRRIRGSVRHAELTSPSRLCPTSVDVPSQVLIACVY